MFYSFATSLPFELLQNILTSISEFQDDRERIKTLLMCSLVCQDFKDNARRLVYSRICINEKHWEWEAEDILKIVEDEEKAEEEKEEEEVSANESWDIYSTNDISTYQFDHPTENEASDSSEEFIITTHAFLDSRRFIKLIHTVPTIVPLIHGLEYNAHYWTDKSPKLTTELTHSFTKITHLKSLTIDALSMGVFMSSDNFKKAITHLFTLPSLVHLQLRASFFPTAMIAQCIHILTLHLEVEYNVIESFASARATDVLPCPISLRARGMITVTADHLHPGDTILSRLPLHSLHCATLDFSQLHTLAYDKLKQDEFLPLMKEVKGCRTLHTVSLAYEDSINSWTWTGLNALLSLETLRSLTLNSPWLNSWGVPGPSYPPEANSRDVFHNLLDVLSTAHNTRLEILSLAFTLPCIFVYHTLGSSWRPGSWCQWSRLASTGLLASWPRLSRLNLYLDITRGKIRTSDCCLITRKMKAELRHSTLSHFPSTSGEFDVECRVADVSARFMGAH